MRPAPPPGFEQIRGDAVRRMFSRKSWLAMVIFEPTFAGLALWVLCTSHDAWRSGVAIGLLVALVPINHFIPKRHSKLMVPLRWMLGVALIAITGGPLSPMLPYLLMSVVSFPSLMGRPPAIAMLVVSIAVVWLTTLFGPHHTDALIHAACMTTLLLGSLVVGWWIREASDVMLRSSLEVRDELLKNHADRLRELTKLQEQLAHELKNPLASIKGLTGLMQLEPARAAERLDVLRREVSRMQKIVEEMLDFSRPLTPVAAETTDVRSIVAAVMRMHEGLAGQKQLSLDMRYAHSVELLGDPHKVKTMLMNLVRNAIEASPPGGTVEVMAKSDEQRVRLAVLDRGPGLCEELLTRAMEPGVTTKPDGSGMGLSIVRALAEQHAGTLKLCNRDGGGLVAEIELPRLCPDEICRRKLA